MSSPAWQSTLFGANTPNFRRQSEIIQQCIVDDLNLAEVLESYGLSIDDLEYANNFRWEGSLEYVTLSRFMAPALGIPIVSFFSGAGGLDLGFEASGFEHVALVEHNALFVETLRANRPHWDVIGPPEFAGDMSNIETVVADLESRIGRSPFPGIFVGGPPCQPFSIASNQRFSKSGDNFKRVGFAHEKNGNLLFRFVDVIRHFRPAAFLIENVAGLVEIDGGEQLKQAYSILRSIGYEVHDPLVLNAAHFHVPQFRTRLFAIGNRLGGVFVPPEGTRSPLPCSGALSIEVRGVANHITRSHSAESVKRYRTLEFGCRDRLGRVDRLSPWTSSKTVIAGGTSGGGRSHLHPYIPRTLSVRESARLQTFPDDYIFRGPVARQFTQVGNAVPPILAAQLGTAIAQTIFKK